MVEVSESELMDACREGYTLDCSENGVSRSVDGGMLRRCCYEYGDQIDPHGIMLQNAVITGRLDLADMRVPFPLRFDGCEFEAAPIVEGAKLHELALTSCMQLPGLLANGLQIRHDLNLSGSRIAGSSHTAASTTTRSAIWLCESDIGGRLLCVDTVIHAEGQRSLQADLMHVGGTVRLMRQFRAFGEVRLLGVRIDGSLDLTGARVESSALALDVAEATIGGSLFIIDDENSGHRPYIHGRIDMGSTHIGGQFLIRNATLRAQGPVPGGVGHSRSWVGSAAALSAPRLSVAAEMAFEGSSNVIGGLDLSLSDISGIYVSKQSALQAPGQTALDLTNAELRAGLTIHSGSAVQGTIRLTGARIHGELSLRGARLSAPQRSSLVSAQDVVIDGDLLIQDLQADGGRLRFGSATIGGVIAVGAQLENPGGFTLGLHQAVIRGSVILASGFKSTGLVMLSRSAIGGRLECSSGTFSCPAPFERNKGGHAIEAVSTTIRGGIELAGSSISPSVDFTNATTTFLADDPENWPSRFIISGFVYDRFEHLRGTGSARVWDRTARISWLRRQAVYDASPYEQAARVFRQHGYASQAEDILIAQRRHARRAVPATAMLRRTLDALYDHSVGYGYRPARALWLLFALLLAVTISLEIPATQQALRATTPAGIVYTTHGPLGTAASGGAPSHRSHVDACGNGQVHCFSPIFYAVDTVLPLISLDQRSTWYPDPQVRYGSFMQWWLNVATLLGWLFSSIFILSFARLARAT